MSDTEYLGCAIARGEHGQWCVRWLAHDATQYPAEWYDHAQLYGYTLAEVRQAIDAGEVTGALGSSVRDAVM